MRQKRVIYLERAGGIKRFFYDRLLAADGIEDGDTLVDGYALVTDSDTVFLLLAHCDSYVIYEVGKISELKRKLDEAMG